jgi:hypothetical protein
MNERQKPSKQASKQLTIQKLSGEFVYDMVMKGDTIRQKKGTLPV